MNNRLIQQTNDYLRQSVSDLETARRWESEQFRDKARGADWRKRARLFDSLAKKLVVLQGKPVDEILVGVRTIIRDLNRRAGKGPNHLYESIIVELEWILKG